MAVPQNNLCPRCDGLVFVTRDGYGDVIKCISCGNHSDLPETYRTWSSDELAEFFLAASITRFRNDIAAGNPDPVLVC